MIAGSNVGYPSILPSAFFQEGLLKNSIIDSQNRKKTTGIAVSTYYCAILMMILYRGLRIEV
jgi:hypothetical protein